MIDIDILRNNPDVIKKAVRERGWQIDVDAVCSADESYRNSLKRVEDLRRELKSNSLKSSDEAIRESLRALKITLKAEEETLNQRLQERDKLLRDLPNIPKDDVPVGIDESANEVCKIINEPTSFSFTPKDYLALAEAHELIDLERAAKVSGARFAYLKNEAALLSMALVRYGLKIALENGFTPVLPPVLINEEAMAGMGYLDHGGSEETYHFDKDNLYLVGTSEQSIGPMHMREIIEENRLPLRYVAFSTCFRREAGAAGKDTRGILRVHQFDKLEMFSFTTPDQSDHEHEFLLSIQEKFMQELELPYRVVKLSTGDMGGPSARTYDIETWIPSQNKYRETHSTSTTTDFQSRRLMIRYRSKEGAVAPLHCLNGTVVAVNRPLIAILENYQQEDGSIVIPNVLQEYIGKKKIG